jgi:hypothetical protein
MKRFSIAERWPTGWHLALSPETKLVYVYVYDHCDEAGVWKPNWSDAEDEIGHRPNPAAALRELDDRVEVLANGDWWVRSFIADQYGQISTKRPAHQPVFEALQRAGIKLPNRYVPAGPKPPRPPKPPKPPVPLPPALPPPSKDFVLELERLGPSLDEPKGITVIHPGKGAAYDPLKEPLPVLLNTPDFREAWTAWIAFRREKGAKLTPLTVQFQLRKLVRVESFVAILMLHQSITNGWTGLFDVSPREIEAARLEAEDVAVRGSEPLPENVRQFLEAKQKDAP